MFKMLEYDPKSITGFDPSVHNAISMIEAEGAKKGDIVQVYQKGYMYKQRVLRAAMVVVAK